MGGCASKDKKQNPADGGDVGNNGQAEGCVSNSMVFLAR